jgi:urease accessory protein
VRAVLHFASGGGRTFLKDQHVPYPFHITRPHALDPLRPAHATLILQSAAGGLYRGDRLALDVSAGPGTVATVRSQAATVVHAAGHPIGMDARVAAAEGAVLTLATEPYILFPGTSLSVSTEVTLAADATAILAEGFATHDPGGRDSTFGALSTRCRVVRPDGTVLVDDAGAIDGGSFSGDGSPLGPYRAMGTVMILGDAARGIHLGGIEETLDGLAVLGASTRLPNGAGVCVRLLARDGGRLARGSDAVLAAVFQGLHGGALPARR